MSTLRDGARDGTVFERPAYVAGRLWSRLMRLLHARGIVPLPEFEYRKVEDRVATAIPAVHARDEFRRALGSNLELMAQSKRSGIVVQMARPPRTGLVVGISAGALLTVAGVILAIVLLTRGRAKSA